MAARRSKGKGGDENRSVTPDQPGRDSPRSRKCLDMTLKGEKTFICNAAYSFSRCYRNKILSYWSLVEFIWCKYSFLSSDCLMTCLLFLMFFLQEPPGFVNDRVRIISRYNALNTAALLNIYLLFLLCFELDDLILIIRSAVMAKNWRCRIPYSDLY